MDKIKLSGNKTATGLVLILFVFFRSFFAVPAKCFGINAEKPYFTIEPRNIVFAVLLCLFSVLAAVFVLSLQKKQGNIAAILGMLIIGEPMIFLLQDDCMKLVASLLVLFCLCFQLRNKSLNDIKYILAALISSFLMPLSVMSWIPLLISAYIIINSKAEEPKRITIVTIIQVIASAAGFALNSFICSRSEAAKQLLHSFSFGEATSEKSLSFGLAIIPTFILTLIFLKEYFNQTELLEKKRKARKKENNLSGRTFLFVNLIVIQYALAIIGMIFLESEAFYTVNIILPTWILAMVMGEDEVCAAVIEKLSNFVKNHKVITAVIIVAVFYISFAVTELFISSVNLTKYIRFH